MTLTSEQLDIPEDVSKACIELTYEIEDLGLEMTKAELAEDKYAVDLLKGLEKVSVAQAEKEALVATNNRYHELRYKREALLERLQAYKKRIDVLKGDLMRSNIV